MGRIEEGIVTRRALLGGLGAGSAALATSATAADVVGAAPIPMAAPVAPTSAPAVTTLASPHEPGMSYVYKAMYDFRPEIAPVVTPGAYGYVVNFDDPSTEELETGGVGTLMATVDLPPGAVLHDIEWYVHNSEQADIGVAASIWVAGQPYDPERDVLVLPVPLAPDIQVVSGLVPSDRSGPWPDGCKLVLAAVSIGLGGFEVQGARVGYSSAPRSIVMSDRPVRVYDSRNAGGALVPNASRVIPLSAAVPVTAGGALVSLSITAAKGTGTLRVGRAGEAPTATGLQWSRSGDKVTNLVVTGISDTAEMVVQSIAATGSTQVIAEVVGYLV